MPDYVPGADSDYNTWANDLVTYLTTDPDAPMTTADQKKALKAALAVWQPPYDDNLAAQAKANTANTAKDTGRKDSEAIFRSIVGDIQRDPAVTDAQRTAMRVTVPKGSRTAVGLIESHPILTKTDTSTRLRHRLFYADSDTPTTAAKPAGAQFCEIRLQLDGTAPTDPNAMAQLAMESRTPHRNDFDPGDEGKTAYYAMRWLNTKGDPGPWSPVYSAVVPG